MLAATMQSRITGVVLAVLAMSISVPAPTLSAEHGLLGHWTFDAIRDGVAEDSSGQGRPAKVHGATQTEGHLAGALMFDGKDDYVELGDLGEHKATTIAFWMKTDDVDRPGLQALVSSDVWREGVFHMALERGSISYYLHMGKDWRGGPLRGRLASSPLAKDVWHHCAIVADMATAMFSLFTNGVQEDMDDIVQSPTRIKLIKQVVGREFAASGPSRYFRGAIDDVRIYGRALTAAEVRALCPDAPPPPRHIRPSVAPQPRQPTEGNNLARGKLCAFRPHPNYYHCTARPEDSRDLTDGLYNDCRWTLKGTVGWTVGRVPVFTMFIDLGAAYPIGKITFDSSTDLRADVAFPAAVLAFVSTDGKQYDLLGDVLTESLPQGSFRNHRYAADDLKGWGRYVRLAILPGGHYVFCDEIEIMEGAHTREHAQYINEKPIPAKEVKNYAIQMKGWADQKNATLALLREADDAVTARSTALGDGNVINAARKQIDKERAGVRSAKSSTPADYSQGPPYREWDRRAFQVVAGLNARIWPGRPVVIWQKTDWEWLRPLEAPVGRETGAQVRVEMMNNEWATSGFIVTSASAKALALSLTAADFRGPEPVSADRVLRISHVVHAEAVGYSYRDDPIVPLEEGTAMLQPGVSKRIWLTFKTRGMDLKPGTYTSKVSVSVDGKPASSVPVALCVRPLRFPDEVSLHSGSWAYFYEPGLAGHEDAAAQDLLDHYNTSLVINHFYLPRLKADAQGNLEPLDFTKMDKLLEWNRQCRLWLIWPGFEFGNHKMGMQEFGTPAWEKAFTQYVTRMRDHLKEKGLSRKQFAWYWTDEPKGDEWEKHDLPASKLLKKIDPEMLVWADPSSSVTVKQLEASLPYFDAYCMGRLSSAILDVCHRTNLKSWQYVCASSKSRDPFAYYRSLAWKAWKNKLGGIGMWVYADAKNQTFSDYSSGGVSHAKVASYAMVYKGDRGPIGSKRWAAWRQGIADYEYLRMLSDAVAAAREAGVKKEACRRAEAILSQGVDEIIGDKPPRGDIAKRDLADRYRVKILESLTELQGLRRAGVRGQGSEVGNGRQTTANGQRPNGNGQ